MRHNQKQRRLVAEHQGRRDDHLPHGHDPREQHVLHPGPHCFYIGGHAADDSSQLVSLKNAICMRCKCMKMSLRRSCNRLPQFQRRCRKWKVKCVAAAIAKKASVPPNSPDCEPCERSVDDLPHNPKTNGSLIHRRVATLPLPPASEHTASCKRTANAPSPDRAGASSPHPLPRSTISEWQLPEILAGTLPVPHTEHRWTSQSFAVHILSTLPLLAMPRAPVCRTERNSTFAMHNLSKAHKPRG